MHRLRVIRRGWRVDATARIQSLVGYLVIASLVLPLLASGGYYVAAGDPRSPDGPMLWGFLGLTLATVVAGAVWLAAHRRRGAAWWSAMVEAARLLDGRTSRAPAQRLEWLDRHWLGELVPLDVHASAHGGCITLVALGYPVLVMFDPLPLPRARPARLELFLAAAIPKARSPYTASPLIEAWQWFARHGFALEWSDAGLRATASAAMLAALHREPTAARALVPIAHGLAAAAGLVHAEPIPAIP